MSKRFVLLIVGLFLLTIGQAGSRADTLHLKSGRAMHGTIVKETDEEIVLRSKSTTRTYKKTAIASIDRDKPEPEAGKASTERLPAWVRFIDVAGKQPWITELKSIPAVVIDRGIFRNVPYQSWQAGNYELNVYGDPDHPACLEIGVYKELLKSERAKRNCIDFLAAVLPIAADQETLRSLKLAKDSKDRDGFTFEVTPETDEDAYGGWWVSVYSKQLVDQARASDEALKAITISLDDLESLMRKPAPGADSKEGDDSEPGGVELLSSHRSLVGPIKKNGTKSQHKVDPDVGKDGRAKSVYVPGYLHKDGTAVHDYRRAPKEKKP